MDLWLPSYWHRRLKNASGHYARAVVLSRCARIADTFDWPLAGPRLKIVGVKLDELILRHFKIGVFIGVRKANRGMHTAFFINDKEAEESDLGELISGLKIVPAQVWQAYQELMEAAPKGKKRRGRKKEA